ncbi:meiotic chromosome segregation protein Meu6 [Schizosaccharomyces japonicus yFS275]|uniref:Meiotic chromosome segregation protein Meu6 n=1 Tax=Schizosaccharomyces japonicus (strain yFS275 / FY16936) TaxID=402676 RepID=B6K769_SCHJY|nr:meiotic chromosome segregation protein Meu6 [Schizosaccharomyces japonicus yFS275]EEB09373.1 meiotic chromosome segregation protein Meu6 [Schizosaccharomyces japonicus yFS275]
MSSAGIETRPSVVGEPGFEVLPGHSEVTSAGTETEQVQGETETKTALSEVAPNVLNTVKTTEVPTIKHPAFVSAYSVSGHLTFKTNGILPHSLRRFFYVQTKKFELKNLNYYYRKRFYGSLTETDKTATESNPSNGDEEGEGVEEPKEAPAPSSRDYYLELIAHATQTGDGLLFYSKSQLASDSPSGIIPLYDVVAVEPSFDQKFIIATGSGKIATFEAPSPAERDKWVKYIIENVQRYKQARVDVENSEAYKDTFAKLKKYSAESANAAYSFLYFFGKKDGSKSKEKGKSVDKSAAPDPRKRDSVFEILQSFVHFKPSGATKDAIPEEGVKENASPAVPIVQEPEVTDDTPQNVNEDVPETENAAAETLNAEPPAQVPSGASPSTPHLRARLSGIFRRSPSPMKSVSEEPAEEEQEASAPVTASAPASTSKEKKHFFSPKKQKQKTPKKTNDSADSPSKHKFSLMSSPLMRRLSETLHHGFHNSPDYSAKREAALAKAATETETEPAAADANITAELGTEEAPVVVDVDEEEQPSFTPVNTEPVSKISGPGTGEAAENSDAVGSEIVEPIPSETKADENVEEDVKQVETVTTTETSAPVETQVDSDDAAASSLHEFKEVSEEPASAEADPAISSEVAVPPAEEVLNKNLESENTVDTAAVVSEDNKGE